MQIVLVAGGRGTRLWPLSTNEHPKQFIKVLPNNQSLFTKTYENIQQLNYPIYVSSDIKYSELIFSQTTNNIKIILDPFYNNTFAAFLNIATYLKYKERICDDEFIALVPTDHYVEEDFYEILNDAQSLLRKENKDFCLIGIKPTYPSSQYGYILHNDHNIIKFTEKPSEAKAIELISNHALWNSGILIFKLKAMLNISKHYINYESYNDFVNKYRSLPNNSFDYEVLEKRQDVLVIESGKSWEDLGNWFTLYPKISHSDNYNTNIINTENKNIVNNGVENSIIINTLDGLALYKKQQEKVFRKWGYYQVLNTYNFNNQSIKLKYLKIFDGKNISYQKHYLRDEIWFIINGSGLIVINGELRNIEKGNMIRVLKDDKHAIKSLKNLEILEIQLGERTIEEDIERYEYEWEKIQIL